jgi:hypothetical protein
MGTTLITTSTPRITYRIGMRTVLGWAGKFLLPPILRLGEVSAESELLSILRVRGSPYAQNRDKRRYQSVVEKACPARVDREGLRLAPDLWGVRNSYRE